MGAAEPPLQPCCDVLLARFARVVRRPSAAEVPDFTNSHEICINQHKRSVTRLKTKKENKTLYRLLSKIGDQSQIFGPARSYNSNASK
jgi:hypothetical protein